MKLAVVGTGYVGLVSGVGLAWAGHNVTCVDLRQEVVNRILKADPPIHEEGLEPLLRQTVSEGRLHATTALGKALADAELVLVAVGTPSVDGRIDLCKSARPAGPSVGRSANGRGPFRWLSRARSCPAQPIRSSGANSKRRSAANIPP